jgi:5-methyltetrahydrofolate--homocysteine methyltransferase
VLERPWEVARVHAGHAAAGAQVLLTCTFNLARARPDDLPASVEEVARRAVALARAARPGSVAGCAGTTALARPDGGGVSDGELRERYDRAFRALASGGADLLWTETHTTLREARIALASARRTGLSVVATAFLAGSRAGLASPDGAPGEEVLEALWRDGAVAVGVNCVEPDSALAALIARACARVPVPLVAKPNAGLPGAIWSPERFAAGVACAARAGARMLGGCCGADADHLRALRRALPREAATQALG